MSHRCSRRHLFRRRENISSIRIEMELNEFANEDEDFQNFLRQVSNFRFSTRKKIDSNEFFFFRRRLRKIPKNKIFRRTASTNESPFDRNQVRRAEQFCGENSLIFVVTPKRFLSENETDFRRIFDNENGKGFHQCLYVVVDSAAA